MLPTCRPNFAQKLPAPHKRLRTPALDRILTGIQSTHSHPLYLICFQILSFHVRLGSPSSLIPSGFTTKTYCAFLLCTLRATIPILLTTRYFIKIILVDMKQLFLCLFEI